MSGSNPVATVLQIAGGYCLPRCLHVVADLGVADALGETPQSSGALAATVGANPDALARILRALAAHEVFALEGDTVEHTPASRLLRDDHPQSMRAFARMFGLSLNWMTLGALDRSARTGLPAVSEVYPDGVWAYYARHAEAGRIFNGAMASKAHGQVAGVLAAYDFSGFGAIGDIGGGAGHLLRAVLDAAPNAAGILFDLPHVIADATDLASPRLTLRAGDFFRDALPSCNLYLLMEIIHDWSDGEAVAILRGVRAAAPPQAKLLLIEALIPETSAPAWSKLLDIHMLALLGGRQRTRMEYAALLDAAGFHLTRQIDTFADISILEATVA